jgi:16S rRNA G527 N7-methylase RsmG
LRSLPLAACKKACKVSICSSLSKRASYLSKLVAMLIARKISG